MGYDWNHTRQLSSDKKFFTKQMQDVRAVFVQRKQEEIDSETFKTNMKRLLVK